MDKVLEFNQIEKRGRSKANAFSEKGEYLRTLSFLYTALYFQGKDNPSSYQTLMDIADTYADMELYELSNQYWFYYIDVAPKERVSIAYEELAINYFYMDNMLASSYFLHKKLSVDGFISRDGIDKEILEYFAQASQNKDDYHIVYPIENADYSKTLRQAKRELVSGNFEGAVEKYTKIPKGTKQYYDAQSELSIAYFLSGDCKTGIEICRNLIKEYGKDITLCCNLSSMYKYDGDSEKAQYYYANALEFEPKTLEDRYKLATCALEQGDSITAIKHIEFVVKDRPYDMGLRYFYGLVLINDGNYQKADEVFSNLYIINPLDKVNEYYVKLAKDLNEGGEKAEKAKKLLPLEYVEGLPEKEAKKRAKKIKELTELEDKKVRTYLKKPQIIDYLKWGLNSSDEQTLKGSIYLLSYGDARLERILLDALLDLEISPETKRVISYVLILNGRKKKFGVVAHNIYASIKPKKLPCEKDIEGELFFSAYALCLSKMAFISADISEKVAMSANKIYKKLQRNEQVKNFSTEELASLIAIYAKPLEVSERQVTSVFTVKKERLQKLKKLYKGETADENN